VEILRVTVIAFIPEVTKSIQLVVLPPHLPEGPVHGTDKAIERGRARTVHGIVNPPAPRGLTLRVKNKP
jgi:hypothetical protein